MPLRSMIQLVTQANLLQFRGWAVAKEMSDHEGSGSFDFHVELHNPDPSEAVTITHAEWYHSSLGGWLTRGPFSMVPAVQGDDTLLPGPVVGPTSNISYERSNWWANRLSHMVFLFRAESKGHYQHLVGQLPITFTPATKWSPFPAGLGPSLPWKVPTPLPLSAPVFITLMEDLTQIGIPEGNQQWILVTGQVINGTGGAIQITEMSWSLEIEDGHTITGNVPLLFYAYDARSQGFDYDMRSGPSDKKIFAFNYAIRVPNNRIGKALGIKCVYTSTVADSIGSISIQRTSPVTLFIPPQQLIAPVGVTDANLRWTIWNGPQQSGFNAHNGNPGERYAYDLLLLDNSDSTSKPLSDQNSNDSFYAFGKPVRAMADGTVVEADDAYPDNQGRSSVSGSNSNGLVVQHGPNLYAVYTHTRQGSIAQAGIRVGQHVRQGQHIADLGNSGGTTEPHLHIGYYGFDNQTGVAQAIPMQWDHIRDANGQTINAVAISGTKFRVT